MKNLKIEKLIKIDDEVLLESLDNRLYTIEYIDGETEQAIGSKIYVAIHYLRASAKYNCTDALTRKYSILPYIKGKYDYLNQSIDQMLVKRVINNLPEDTTPLERSHIISHMLDDGYNRLIKISSEYPLTPTIFDSLDLMDNDELCALREEFVKHPEREEVINKKVLKLFKTWDPDSNLGRMALIGGINPNQQMDNVFAKGTLATASGEVFNKPIFDPIMGMWRSDDVLMSSADQHIAARAHDVSLGPMNYTIKVKYTTAAAVHTCDDMSCDAKPSSGMPLKVKESDIRLIHGLYAWVVNEDKSLTYTLIDKNNPEVISNIMNKLCYIRTPLSCTLGDGHICSECLGTIHKTYTKGNLAVNLLSPVFDSLFYVVMKTKHNLRHRKTVITTEVKGDLLIDKTPDIFLNKDLLNKGKHIRIIIPTSGFPSLPDIISPNTNINLIDIEKASYLKEGAIEVLDEDGVTINKSTLHGDNISGFYFTKEFIQLLYKNPSMSSTSENNHILTFSNWDSEVPLFNTTRPKALTPKEQVEEWEGLLKSAPSVVAGLPTDPIGRLITLYERSQTDALSNLTLFHNALILRAFTMSVDEDDVVINPAPAGAGLSTTRLVNDTIVARYRGVELLLHISSQSPSWLTNVTRYNQKALETPGIEIDYLAYLFKKKPLAEKAK